MLKVENLQKNYPKFSLRDVSFDVPRGYITGFIGRNGAGKTTTLQSMLNIIPRDGGKVTVFGMELDAHENEIKQRVSYTRGAFDFYLNKRLKTIAEIYGRFFTDWNGETLKRYMRVFDLDPDKTVKQLSEGMKIKFAVALALSHDAELFVFDEPTSGLDPVARDEMLDIFRGLVERGDKAILFSTHVTSDLDKCADFILFIKNGEIILNGAKDEIIGGHLLIAGAASALSDDLKNRMIGFKESAYGFKGLIERNKLSREDDVEISAPDIESIMIYYDKENVNEKFAL